MTKSSLENNVEFAPSEAPLVANRPLHVRDFFNGTYAAYDGAKKAVRIVETGVAVVATAAVVVGIYKGVSYFLDWLNERPLEVPFTPLDMRSSEEAIDQRYQ